MKKLYLLVISIAFTAVLHAFPAHAERPLAVEDANVIDAGTGHLEAWYARMAHGINTWNIAPAYSPLDGWVLSAVLTRDSTENNTVSSIQAKWRITPSNPQGCNLGVAAGVSYARNGGERTPYLSGMSSCNFDGGAVHANFGLAHTEGQSANTTWGLAFERDFGGAVGHIEYFGQEKSRPTVQLGLRKEFLPGWQLDGTIGRNDGDAVFSVGVKKSFK